MALRGGIKCRDVYSTFRQKRKPQNSSPNKLGPTLRRRMLQEQQQTLTSGRYHFLLLLLTCANIPRLPVWIIRRVRISCRAPQNRRSVHRKAPIYKHNTVTHQTGYEPRSQVYKRYQSVRVLARVSTACDP